MFFPAEMSAEEIMDFEFEVNKMIDIERGEGLFWEVNALLAEIAEGARSAEALEIALYSVVE